MIRYALACDQAHAFESWFPSGDAYDAQVARGLVACPICASTRVGKTVMAPSVTRTDRAAVAPAAPPEATPVAAPAAPLLSEPERALRAMMLAFREHVTKHADYVGGRFAEEARKIHHGEEEDRAIYGEADAEEVRALIEEGVEIRPLPRAPEERN
jgi:hypothetical protein